MNRWWTVMGLLCAGLSLFAQQRGATNPVLQQWRDASHEYSLLMADYGRGPEAATLLTDPNTGELLVGRVSDGMTRRVRDVSLSVNGVGVNRIARDNVVRGVSLELVDGTRADARGRIIGGPGTYPDLDRNSPGVFGQKWK